MTEEYLEMDTEQELPVHLQHSPEEGPCNLESLHGREKDVEKILEGHQFSTAAKLYTDMIEDVQLDLCKLYSKRSNVHAKMKNFHQAMSDAEFCIQTNPQWTMGYWRKAEARKGAGDQYGALNCLVKGYNICLTTTPPHRDVIMFMAEIIITLCLVPEDPGSILNDVQVLSEDQFAECVVKVLNHLSKCNQWEAVSLMVLGQHRGVANIFENIGWDADARGVSVGSYIQDYLCNDCVWKWGNELAVRLIKNGASVQDIEIKMNKPALHIAITVALKSEQIGLLEFLLENYIKTNEQKNARDSDGNTGLHLLVKSSKIHSETGAMILKLLLTYDCCKNSLDKEGKKPVDFLNPSDVAYKLLQNTEEKKNKDVLTSDKKISYSAALAKPPLPDPPQKYPAAASSKTEKFSSDSRKGRVKSLSGSSQGSHEAKQHPSKKEKNVKVNVHQENSNYHSKKHIQLHKEGDLELKMKEFLQRQEQKRGSRHPFSPTICHTCERFLEGKYHLNKYRTSKAYSSFAFVLGYDDHEQLHGDIKSESLELVVKTLADTLNPEIPRSLANIPTELYIKMINYLKQHEKYKQMDIMIRSYRRHHGEDALMDIANDVCIENVIRHSSMTGQDDLLSEVVTNMLDSGAVLKDDGKMCLQAATEEQQYKFLCTLLERGANPEYLSLQQGDTPLHAALAIALEKDKDNFTVFDKLLDMFECDPTRYPILNPAHKDANGDGLFHLAARVKYSKTSLKATERLCEKKVSAYVQNNEGKFPKDYLSNRNDRRLQYIRSASIADQMKQKPKFQLQKFPASETSKKEMDASETSDNKKAEKITKTSKKVLQSKLSIHREATRKKVEDMIFRLPDKPYSIFNPKSAEEEGCENKKLKVEKKEEILGHTEGIGTADTNSIMGQIQDENVEDETVGSIKAEDFDCLEWEVECSADVWKKLCSNSLTLEQKRRVVYKIHQLANGGHQSSQAVSEIPSSLNLYMEKASKDISIIWESAIAYSPRLNNIECVQETHDKGFGCRMYSELVRVWDIVVVCPQTNSIDQAILNIKKSHERGKSCLIKKTLKGKKAASQSSAPTLYFEIKESENEPERRSQKDHQEDTLQLCVPASSIENEYHILKFYSFSQNLDHKEDTVQLCVPASSIENEYHILKFYSFSPNLVHHILQNIETKVDFPFRVTDIEHVIINLQLNAPILLLGRSGTGKTTCCLYRLWTEFENYWRRAIEEDSKLRERQPLLIIQENLDDHSESDTNGSDEEGSWVLENDLYGNKDRQETNEEENDTPKFDHLHQIFITKNAVLCKEVQKSFGEFIHASCIAVNQVQTEGTPLPARLQDVADHQYPLFVTSKQLLLMLDASLMKPYFFERYDDGTLKDDIHGWSNDDDTLNILPMLNEESDDEDENDVRFDDILDDVDMVEDNIHQNRRAKIRVDKRREVTYDVFSNEVWPRIAKTFAGKYHPSLIWTEIMSFIKGSFEALSKPFGFLTEEEYFKMGKKRAPNFSGDREHIYVLFKRYDQFKKMHALFDETDIIRDVYTRLNNVKDLAWVIHQIYVDETQDFTQAELSLLLKLCQNPNEMFLTGDTAQSIMRGISFRFSELLSLFYIADGTMRARGETKRVTVPEKIHQLTHNYRSHAGILSLASSILDLMARFFPESFDSLQKDQGLFNGPSPVLLESCSFGDIAVLLSGSKRKTSNIEFGAHQAILVVDETARETIPEELKLGLILTIYEAKGLEFDDILLYNFFKDSQAGKEWRVVTEYLEDMASENNQDRPNQQNLVEIDAEMLKLSGRPRSLKFDPNCHKLLNSELKHLYTAVTRARVNVWIFDEDMEKRAPIFEYFKARKLTKTLNTTDVDAELSDGGGVFAEKSTKADWVKRGQDFMKHSLFEIAVKCFRIGGDQHLVKEAIAHQQALVALRTKDSYQVQRNEYLSAAEKFLDCNLPSKAAKCLVKAKETGLLPQIFEKTGQLERAAEAYKILEQPLEVGRCYEQLGWYDEAIETFYKNNSFERALEVLGRYEELKKQCDQDSHNPYPAVLKDHAPKKQHTQGYLCFQAAEYFLKNGNETRMFAIIDRLPTLLQKTDFLKQHGYFEKAAEMLHREEFNELCSLKMVSCWSAVPSFRQHPSSAKQFEESATLYLQHGQPEKAIVSARQSKDKDLLARCLLVFVRVTIHQKSYLLEKTTDENKLAQKREMVQHLQEAIDLTLTTNNCDLRGEAAFMKGEIIHEITDINESWGAFNKALPFRNETGQLECMHWMVHNSSLRKQKNCVQVILGMKNLFGVLDILWCTDDGEEEIRKERVYNYFGFKSNSHSKDVLKIFPLEKPRAYDIIKNNQSDVEGKAEKDVSKELAKTEICRYLLERGVTWLNKIVKALSELRQMYTECPKFLLGMDCTPACIFRHEPQTRTSFRELLNVDLLMIELDCFIVNGAAKLLRYVPRSITNMVEVFMPDSELNPLARFRSCSNLIEDLMSKHFFPWQVINYKECLQTRNHLLQRRYAYVADHILKYLRFIYDQMKTKKEKNTDVFLKIAFLTRFFEITTIQADTVMLDFEHEVLQDVLKLWDNNEIAKIRRSGFLVEPHEPTECSKITVECIARRFYESFDQLIFYDNVMESFIKFTKFTTLLAKQKKKDILPEMHEFLMWIEYYTVMGFCLAAKVNEDVKVFFLPSSYISTVYFIDSSSMCGPLFERIQKHRSLPHRDDSKLVKDRLDKILNILFDPRFNLINVLFKASINRALDYLIAERLLVLCFTYLCNIGWSIDSDKETYMMKALNKIKLPKGSPPRLVQAVKAIKSADGQIDIARALKELLFQRNSAQIQLCKIDRREGILFERLDKLVVMKPNFINFSRHVVHKDDERENKAATVITRFIRWVGFIKKCKLARVLVEETLRRQKVEPQYPREES